MSERRLALIIANYDFDDKRLQKLKSPAKDAESLGQILKNSEIGNFDDVNFQINKTSSALRKEINLFFSKKLPDDVLLFYYSGHGVVDSRGRLFLTTKETEMELLRSTAIPSSFIIDEMDECRSKRQILILDCCYSGSVIQGVKSGIGTKINTSIFQGNGYGRIILSATDALQLAWEGDQVIGDITESLFTHYFIEGLITGDANPFREWISVDDIYEYVYRKVLSYQNPQKTSLMQEGEILIAHNPKPRFKPQFLTEGISLGKQEFVGDSSIFGIDFGTTKSAISVIHDGKPIIIRNDRGEKFTPSVVTFMANGDIAIGAPAIVQAFSNPQNAFFNIKRNIEQDVQFEFDNKKFTFINVASKIFESLKRSAKKYCKDNKFQAVICAPAYFTNRQKSAIITAATEAGFDVLRMIPEPVSAVLAYGVEKNDTVVVCDLGGGTFDVSILYIGDGVAHVLALSGDNSLGGIDFDQRIVSFLIKDFFNKYKIDLSHDEVVRMRLADAAEQAKIVLSELEVVNIFVPNIYADINGVKNINTTFTRQDFEEVTLDLVDKIDRCCRSVLHDLGDVDSVNKILLVGLSTQIPAVKERISDVFKIIPSYDIDPEDAVAIGAAIQGGVLSGNIRSVLLLDAVPFSLGVKLFDKSISFIIERNSLFPTRRTASFQVHNPGQTKIIFIIIQGGEAQEIVTDVIGTVVLEGIQITSRPQVEVTFDVDANGTLTVTAHEKDTDNKVIGTFNVLQIGKTGNIFQDLPIDFDKYSIEKIPEDGEVG